MKNVQVGLLLMAATLLVGSAIISRADRQINGLPFEVCGIGIGELMACQPAVTNPPAAPTADCCDVVRNADLTCLCSYKSQLSSMKSIDPKLVMALPQKCQVYNIPSACQGQA